MTTFNYLIIILGVICNGKKGAIYHLFKKNILLTCMKPLSLFILSPPHLVHIIIMTISIRGVDQIIF